MTTHEMGFQKPYPSNRDTTDEVTVPVLRYPPSADELLLAGARS